LSGQCESSQQSGAEQETQAHRTKDHDRRHHRAESLGLRCICVHAAAALSPSAGIDPSLEMNVGSSLAAAVLARCVGFLLALAYGDEPGWRRDGLRKTRWRRNYCGDIDESP